MSAAPSPAPDDELRLKRSALAWEIIKYQRESKAKAEAEAAKLALELQRFALDERKYAGEQSFWRRLGPTIVTSVTAVAGALVGFAGVMINNQTTLQTNQRNITAQAALAQMNSRKSDASGQIEDRARILASNPRDVAEEIFRRLGDQSTSPADRLIWDQGKEIASSKSNTVPPSASGTVYVQYNEPTNAAAMDAVIGALTKAGYYVPGKEKVVQETSGDIRYFGEKQDTATESTAKNIASIVQEALASAQVPRPITTKNLHAAFPKVPKTTFEVWLPSLADGAPPAR